MIVRQRPNGFHLFFILRGSILPRVKNQLIITILLAILVTWTQGYLFSFKITLTPIPFTLIGLALAIFLGFRNSASYDRYWEGRKLWGEALVVCRSLGRQITTLIAPASTDLKEDERRRIIYRLIAFSHAMRHHLRDSNADSEIEKLIPLDEMTGLKASSNKPNYLLQRCSHDLATCLQEQRVSPHLASNIDQNFTRLAGVHGACERIKTTPLPFSYSLLLHRTAYLYCFLLPFGLVDSIGYMTPFVVGIISYTFFGFDALGDEIEEPFGLLANDLPLSSICRTIEINLREALGEEHNLKPTQAINYCLS